MVPYEKLATPYLSLSPSIMSLLLLLWLVEGEGEGGATTTHKKAGSLSSSNKVLEVCCCSFEAWNFLHNRYQGSDVEIQI